MDIEALGDVGVDGAESAAGFEGLSPFDDAGERFVAADAEDFLRDDGAFVEVGGDEVGGDSDDFHAAFVSLTIGIGAGKSGKERGMDVDDFVFPAPDEVGREDFHEAGEDDEVGFVFFEKLEDFAFGLRAVVKGDEMEREFVFAGDGCECGSVADDDNGLCAEPGSGLGEEAFEHVGFFCHENGEALAARGGEMDLGFHTEVAARLPDVLLDFCAVEARGRPRGLEGHAELSARDLFFEGLDVGAELEEELGDPGDDARLVMADQGDGGELFGHEGAEGKKICEMRFLILRDFFDAIAVP